MADFDAEMLAEQATLLGLVPRDQMRAAQSEARDGSVGELKRVLLRRQLLTGWQIDRLLKGYATGFFFGGYEVLFHLAEGTFARVYRGRKANGDESVAIKVLRQRFTQDADAVERFNYEAEAGMKLVHPNIVRIYDYGAQDNRHYMIMEFVEGSNLRDFLKFRHRLDAKEAMPILLGLARGMQYSLSKGITHRDIKPTNILISSSGTAKLVDFGLATIQGDERKLAQAHGQRTVDYSALERTCGSDKGDPRSDIYFLGCIYYQVLTGRLPLPEVEATDPLAKMLKRSFGAIKPISEMEHAPDLELCQIIDRMMKVDLKQRYQTMDDVVKDLEAYYARLTGQALPQEEHESEEEFDIETLYMKRVKEQLEEREAQEQATRAAVTDASSSESPSSSKPEPQAPTSSSTSHEAAPPNGDAQPPGSASSSSDSTAPESIDEEPEADLGAFEIPAFQQKQVLCLEAQPMIQDAFRKTLNRMGYRVLIVGDAERAAERFRESPADVVLLDTDGIGSDAVDAFIDMHEKAHEDGHELTAVVLLGPRQQRLADRLPSDDHMVILHKPLKMKQVQDALTQLAPAQAG